MTRELNEITIVEQFETKGFLKAQGFTNVHQNDGNDIQCVALEKKKNDRSDIGPVRIENIRTQS